jgi:hypothetical protein
MLKELGLNAIPWIFTFTVVTAGVEIFTVKEIVFVLVRPLLALVATTTRAWLPFVE